MCKGTELPKSDIPNDLPVHLSKINFITEDKIKKDLIAQFTQLTKELLQQLKILYHLPQSWKYYR